MLNYQSVNGANIVSLEDSEKNDFLPQNDVFLEYLKFSSFSQNNDLPKHNLANSTFLGIKDIQIWPEIALMIPHRW